MVAKFIKNSTPTKRSEILSLKSLIRFRTQSLQVIRRMHVQNCRNSAIWKNYLASHLKNCPMQILRAPGNHGKSLVASHLWNFVTRNPQKSLLALRRSWCAHFLLLCIMFTSILFHQSEHAGSLCRDWYTLALDLSRRRNFEQNANSRMYDTRNKKKRLLRAFQMKLTVKCCLFISVSWWSHLIRCEEQRIRSLSHLPLFISSIHSVSKRLRRRKSC